MSAQWKKLDYLGSFVPWPSNAGKAIRSVNNTVQKSFSLVKTLINYVNILNSLYIKYVDSSLNFISQVASLIKRIVNQISTIGGHYIIIHPYNRSNIRKTKFGIGSYSIELPSLTVNEIINQELPYFINNKNDPNRPVLGADIKAAGFGFLVTATTPADLSSALLLLNQIFSDEEFLNVYRKFEQTITNNRIAKSEFYKSGFPEAIKNTGDWFNESLLYIKKLGIESKRFHDENDINNPDWNKTKESLLWWSARLGDLSGLNYGKAKWKGMSLQNIPVFSYAATKINQWLDSLIELSSSTNNQIKELINVLNKRLNYISQLINEIVTFITAIERVVTCSGIYYINIPKNTGGINYITKYLQTATNNTYELRNISGTNQFSAIFLAVLGVEANYEAWENIFNTYVDNLKERFNSSSLSTYRRLGLVGSENIDILIKEKLEKVIKSSSDFLQENTDFVIYPYELNNNFVSTAPYDIKGFKLIHNFYGGKGYYYSYELRDENNNIISSFISTASNKALFNKTTFDIKIEKEGSYTLTVTGYTNTGEVFKEKTTKFVLTKLLTGTTTSISADLEIPTNNNYSGASSIIGPDGSLSVSYFSNGSNIKLGSNLTSGIYRVLFSLIPFDEYLSPDLKAKILKGYGYSNVFQLNANSISIPMAGVFGQIFYSFTYLPNIIYVDNYPVTIKLNFKSLLRLKFSYNKKESDWYYLYTPCYLQVFSDITFKYQYYLNDKDLFGTNEYTCSILKQVGSSQDIC